MFGGQQKWCRADSVQVVPLAVVDFFRLPRRAVPAALPWVTTRDAVGMDAVADGRIVSFMSAPASRRVLTASSLPARTANSNALKPPVDRTLTSAPSSSNT